MIIKDKFNNFWKLPASLYSKYLLIFGKNFYYFLLKVNYEKPKLPFRF